MKKAQGTNYIIEFISVGNAVKVSAIDPVTQTEVSIVGDPHLSKGQLSRLAIRKLEYMMAKKSGGGK